MRLSIVQLAPADRSHNYNITGANRAFLRCQLYCILTNRSLLFHYIIVEVLSVLYFWNALKSVKRAYIYLLPFTSQLRTVTSEGFGIARILVVPSTNQCSQRIRFSFSSSLCSLLLNDIHRLKNDCSKSSFKPN